MNEEQRTSTDTTLDAGERAPLAAVSELASFRLLLVVTTAQTSRVVELEDRAEWTVGRVAPADILVADPSLSRMHARLTREGESIRVVDLGSRNGTWIGGKRVEEAVVRVGSTLALGSVSLAVQLAPSPAAAALGLLDSAAMLEAIEQECVRSRTFQRPLTILIVRPLRAGSLPSGELGARCLAVLRPSDRAGFYDRDALVALLPETSDQDARRLAEQLVSRPNERVPTLACGLASLTQPGASGEQLVSAALLALHGTSAARPLGSATSPQPVRSASGEPMVRRSGAMLELQRMIERLAPRRISVLLLGETGTGKELVARELHDRSQRRRAPLKVVNCAAIPEPLTESVLFGHVRGAFTGAHRDQPGVFAQAHGGTIFLDEVGELSSEAQAALLRVLDTQRLTPVGSCEELEVDVRVVAATHRDLGAMAEQGRFRLDLYHRLNSVVLRIPPLRERPEEIMPLVEHFLDQFGSGGGRPSISHDARALLLAYRWPGNVRELRNVVERAVALIEGEAIRASDLPAHVAATVGSSPLAPEPAGPPIASLAPAIATAHEVGLRASLRQHEVGLIKDALRRSEGNQRRAASLLRVPLRTFERKLKILGMRGAH